MRTPAGIALPCRCLARRRQNGRQHNQGSPRRHAQARLLTEQPPGADDRVHRLQRDDHAGRARFQAFQALEEQELRQTGAEHAHAAVGHGQQGKRQARAQASEQADGAFVEHGQRTGRYGGRWQHQLRGLKSRSWQPSLRNVARANTPGWRGAGL